MSAVWTPMLAAVTITTATRDLQVIENATTYTATLAAGTYFLRGDGSSDDLAKALKTALDGTAGSNTYTVAVSFNVDPASKSATVTVTRATGSDNFALLWADGSTTLDPALFGCSANTATNSSAKASTLTPSCVWLGNKPPSTDTRGTVRASKQVETPSGIVQTVVRGGRRDRLRFGFVNVAAERTLAAKNTSDPAAAFDSFLEDFGDGRRWEVHEAETSSGTTLEALSGTELGEFVPDSSLLEDFSPSRLATQALYSFEVPLRGYVAP